MNERGDGILNPSFGTQTPMGKIETRLGQLVGDDCTQSFKVENEIILLDDKKLETVREIIKNRKIPKSQIKDFLKAPTAFLNASLVNLDTGFSMRVTEANNVIHVERHWNPAKEAQATDRVYRIGSKRDVNIYVPILHHPEMDSFDVNLHRLLSKKTTLKDAVVTPEEADLPRSGIFNTPGSEDKIVEDKDLKTIPWGHFEALVAEVYAKYYKAESYLTATSNDRGCDVVVFSEKDNMLIQCKHTTKHILKGEGPVRELLAAPTYYKQKIGKSFSKSIVVTNAKSFSRPTQQASKRENIDLVGFKKLSKMLFFSKVTFSDIFKRLDKKRIE